MIDLVVPAEPKPVTLLESEVSTLMFLPSMAVRETFPSSVYLAFTPV